MHACVHATSCMHAGFSGAAASSVELYIITKPFVGGTDFKAYMHA